MTEDLRVQKTKRALRTALLELMKEKPIDLITTTELCKRAEVNRNTFYAHYSSPFLLLQTIEDEYIAVVMEIVNETLEDADHGPMLERICESMNENRELTSILLSENGNRNYLNRFIGVMHSHVIDFWAKGPYDLNSDDLEILYYYTTFGVQKCIQQWTEDGFRMPPKELARKLNDLSEVVLTHYMRKKEI